jgi:hypothetical protein
LTPFFPAHFSGVGMGDGSVRSVSAGVSVYSWNLALNPADGQSFDYSW